MTRTETLINYCTLLHEMKLLQKQVTCSTWLIHQSTPLNQLMINGFNRCCLYQMIIHGFCLFWIRVLLLEGDSDYMLFAATIESCWPSTLCNDAHWTSVTCEKYQWMQWLEVLTDSEQVIQICNNILFKYQSNNKKLLSKSQFLAKTKFYILFTNYIPKTISSLNRQ